MAAITVRLISGNAPVVAGLLLWTPTARSTAANVVTLPNGFAVALGPGASTVVQVPNSDGLSWCWRVDEMVPGGTTRFVTVNGDAEYAALTDVNPATLASAPSGAAVFAAALAAALATLAPVARSGIYADLTGAPTYAAVASSGAYADLTGRPTIPNGQTIQVFTANGIWTKPAGCTSVRVMLIGGGGGGGSGRQGAALTVRGGGGGGGGAGSIFHEYNPAVLAATVGVTIGGGGPGGAAVATPDTPGNAGSTGGTTTFGTYAARGGAGGGGGTTGGGAAGAAGGSGAMRGSSGAIGGASGSGGTGDATGLSGGGGGGGGGGISAADVPFAGGLTYTQGERTSYQAISGGTVPGGNGNGGLALQLNDFSSGSGGGGGAASITGNAGNGGNGGSYGGGGGGGGAALNGFSSGTGGLGAPGIAVIVTL